METAREWRLLVSGDCEWRLLVSGDFSRVEDAREWGLLVNGAAHECRLLVSGVFVRGSCSSVRAALADPLLNPPHSTISFTPDMSFWLSNVGLLS